jgi:hypothetical protein
LPRTRSFLRARRCGESRFRHRARQGQVRAGRPAGGANRPSRDRHPPLMSQAAVMLAVQIHEPIPGTSGRD